MRISGADALAVTPILLSDLNQSFSRPHLRYQLNRLICPYVQPIHAKRFEFDEFGKPTSQNDITLLSQVTAPHPDDSVWHNKYHLYEVP